MTLLIKNCEHVACHCPGSTAETSPAAAAWSRLTVAAIALDRHTYTCIDGGSPNSSRIRLL